MLDILYSDRRIVVCCKPVGVRSTDEPGGLPEQLRHQLGTDCFRTVHRLDQVVGGVMVLARSREAAKRLSAQVEARQFCKTYLAIVHGALPEPSGTLTDLLARDPAARRTYVTHTPGKDARKAVLDYRLLGQRDGLSLVCIQLQTGRTHQIRAQFSSRGWPLVGDRKYGAPAVEMEGIALWSYRLSFTHPQTGQALHFSALPPDIQPWRCFSDIIKKEEAAP